MEDVSSSIILSWSVEECMRASEYKRRGVGVPERFTETSLNLIQNTSRFNSFSVFVRPEFSFVPQKYTGAD